MDKTYNVGILGHGFIGEIHREVIEEGITGLEVVLIAEPEDSRIVNLRGKYELFNSYQELISELSRTRKKSEIDALIIALPTKMHREAISALYPHKIPLLIEKPLGVDLAEAEEILKLVETNSWPCFIGLTGRFHPEFNAAYQALQAGEIGKVVSMQERIHFGFSNFPRQYLRSEHSGRGIGLENGIHTFDRLNYFSGSPVVRVEGLTKSNQHLHEPLEDYVAGIAITENGLHIPFSLRWTENPEEDYIFQITGTKGTLTVEGFRRCTLTRKEDRQVLYEHDLTKTFRDRHKPGIKAELEQFVRYLKAETNQNLIREALAAQKGVELLYPR